MLKCLCHMSDEKISLYKNDLNKRFKIWLESNFGFYSSGILIDASYDSNILYQYNPETNKLQSSYMNVDLKCCTSYEIIKRNENLFLYFYSEDVVWSSYMMVWINENAPEYFNLNYLKENNEN